MVRIGAERVGLTGGALTCQPNVYSGTLAVMQKYDGSSAPTMTLTIEEAARELRLSPLTVRRWVKAGKLPGVWLGNRWRIRRSDLAGLLAETSTTRTT